MKRRKRILLVLLFAVVLGVFGLSVRELYTQWRETQNSKNLTQSLAQQAIHVSESYESGDTSQTGVPISVDFQRLWEENPDIVAWLYGEDTPISYPIAQSEDNDYYLRRLLDGSYNVAGTIFLDYRCPSDFSGWNHVVYGHHMKNKTMFGSLADYQDQSYYDEHPILYLCTPDQTYQVELVAGYVTPSDSAVYDLNFRTQEDRDRFLEEARAKSAFVSTAEAEEGEGLITLSTCSYEYQNARFILIGILKPVES
jgi:sortase B